MTLWPGNRLRTRLANASLRVRVMVAAAMLVTVTSVVMGALGTTVLRGYLFDRADTQLLTFASVSRVTGWPPPKLVRGGPAQLPSLFLVEGISAERPPAAPS